VPEHFASDGPFARHVREAIALNETRAPLYAALSGDASRPISRRLILAERAVLLIAPVFDRLAAPYHRAGISLFEDLFAPMASAPPFVHVGSATPGDWVRPERSTHARARCKRAASPSSRRTCRRFRRRDDRRQRVPPNARTLAHPYAFIYPDDRRHSG
jgi:hypothetical protein